ncbi:heterokaryon incompatibility protein-domain-containing protein, partial [Cercophora newfieldiana]
MDDVGNYMPLDPSALEIRLLSIHLPQAPDNDDDPIHLTLEKASLLQPSRYVALSYTWGDPSQTKEVILNNRRHRVTDNLHSALHQLRAINGRSDAMFESDAGAPLHGNKYWIDAVCIDQSNVSEKNYQVPLMTRIYRGAAEIYVWLGQSNWEIDVFGHYILAESADERAALMPQDELFFLLRCVAFILFKPWWRRLWIIQEFI